MELIHKAKSRKMELDKGVRHIMLYGLALATLIFGLKWLQWNFLIVDNAIDLYIGLIAIIFTILGMWVASQLIKPKTQTVFVEKQIIIPQPQKFILNQTAVKKTEFNKSGIPNFKANSTGT